MAEAEVGLSAPMQLHCCSLTASILCRSQEMVTEMAHPQYLQPPMSPSSTMSALSALTGTLTCR